MRGRILPRGVPSGVVRSTPEPPPRSGVRSAIILTRSGGWGVARTPPDGTLRGSILPRIYPCCFTPTNPSLYLSSTKRIRCVDIVDTVRGQNGQKWTEWPKCCPCPDMSGFGQIPDIFKGSGGREVEVDMSGHVRTCPEIVRTSSRHHPPFSPRGSLYARPVTKPHG